MAPEAKCNAHSVMTHSCLFAISHIITANNKVYYKES